MNERSVDKITGIHLIGIGEIVNPFLSTWDEMGMGQKDESAHRIERSLK